MDDIIDEIREKEEELARLYADYESKTANCDNIECEFYQAEVSMHCAWTNLVTTCNKYIAE